MKKYFIATSDSLAGLEDEVNEKMVEGYIPIGIIGLKRHGVAQTEKMFYQPMILTTNEKPKQ